MPTTRIIRVLTLPALVVAAVVAGLAPATAEAPLLALHPGAGGGAWQTMGSPGAAVAITPEAGVAGGGGTPVRLDFTLPAPMGWAGVVVLAAPDAWGAAPGPGYDLSAADRLTFRARGGAGGERVRIKVAIAGDQPHGDSSPLPFDGGWLTLSPHWQAYTLPVDGRRLGRVVTPFVLIANHQHNPGGRPTVWLDRIRFEAPAR